MASFGQHMAYKQPPSQNSHGTAYPTQGGASGAVAPAGTFAPGTKIQVGSHRVVIQKYLSEGGFAHVYLVKLPTPVNGTDDAVLKRVAVPDREALRGMRTEVETMKRLKGHRMIVTYIDSHASELKGGGYEVFLLMEFCGGGGLIDFMNTRLQHRLTEPEILNIFCDISEGVACMHYLKPPLLHRDLKIENVLITSKGSSKRFKLCDFGSTAPPKPAPTSIVECRLMDEDVQRHTTLQYRSPEMVDVYRKQPLNEKSDIWALGVFLYKLCYYTTPFEDQGQLAILNASYRFPSSPPFSDRLKKLIASMLKENMDARPNIYQVLKEACVLLGREVPIPDIYSQQPSRNSTQAPTNAPARDVSHPKSAVGAAWSPPAEQKEKIPEITPMRRGRPTTSIVQPQQQSMPPARGTKGDPFAALDSKSSTDDFSSRFPSLDQFSLLHDSGNTFDFGSSPTSDKPETQGDQHKKTTDRLADEAFKSSQPLPAADIVQRPHSVTPTQLAGSARPQPTTSSQASPRMVTHQNSAPSPRVTVKQNVGRVQSIVSSKPEMQPIASHNYVSIGTSTSDLDLPAKGLHHKVSQLHITEPSRSSSVPRQPHLPANDQTQPGQLRPSMIERLPSYQSTGRNEVRQTMSRQSSENARASADMLDTPRSHFIGNRPRPQSSIYETTTTVDYLKEREAMSRPQSRMTQKVTRDTLQPLAKDGVLNQSSDLEFLRSMEESERKNHKRLSSLSTSKASLTTTFGDAFNRFESSKPGGEGGERIQSPDKEVHHRDLSPTTGSKSIVGESNGRRIRDAAESMTPETRRDLERRKLEEAERRVEAAQEEHRNRVVQGQGGPGSSSEPEPEPASRVISIQERVQNLLNEEARSAPVQKTAQGYGKYSDAATAASKVTEDKPLPDLPHTPLGSSSKPEMKPSAPVGGSKPNPPLVSGKPKPAAPKKPVHLTGSLGNRPPSPVKPSRLHATQATQQLIATDLPGQPGLDMTIEDRDAYLAEFSQRFPSVSAMDGTSPHH